MRKFVIFFIIFSLCLSLVACNKETPTAAVNNPADEVNTEEATNEATDESADEGEDDSKEIALQFYDGKIHLSKKTVKRVCIKDSKNEVSPVRELPYDEIIYNTEESIAKVVNAVKELNVTDERPQGAYMCLGSHKGKTIRFEYADGSYSSLMFFYCDYIWMDIYVTDTEWIRYWVIPLDSADEFAEKISWEPTQKHG